MILMIDNYDSFTYNLVQYIESLGYEVDVVKNDALSAERIREMGPQAVCLSPGPGRPEDAGVTLDLINKCKEDFPILGICLGFQAIVEAFGGTIVKAKRPMHGKQSAVYHDGRTLYRNVPSPLKVARYHSLVAEKKTLPDVLEVSGETEEGEIMSVRHRSLAIEGVQFHPESVLTEKGKVLLKQFFETYHVYAREGEKVR
ncbi:aminodeoxychorismate/anthranilate synthase component II [Terrilactibacillus sp. S3-3]|nr:aminodeoxychorismate/anthranilate synthase component II [Terrilactibacillus sp. S3-3]